MLDAAYDNGFVSVTGFDGRKPDTYLSIQSESYNDGVSECTCYAYGQQVTEDEYYARLDEFLAGRQLDAYSFRRGAEDYSFSAATVMSPEDCCRQTVDACSSMGIAAEYSTEGETVIPPDDGTFEENGYTVSDAVEDMFSVRTGGEAEYIYRVPRLAVGSAGAEAINAELQSLYLRRAEEQAAAVEAGEDPLYVRIDYRAGIWNNILSLVIECSDYTDGSEIKTYCYDLGRDARLSTQEVVQLAGYSFEEFAALHSSALNEEFDSIWAELLDYEEDFSEEQRALTMSWNDPNECGAYISEYGQLCVAAHLATPGGSGECMYDIRVAPVR